MFFPLFQVFASAASSCTKGFFGLVPWFGYFPNNWFGPTNPQSHLAACDINGNFSFLPQSGQSGLLLIGLALLDDLLRIATLVAVGYVIYSGFQYMTSGGSPDATKRAQSTLINAVVGLVMAILAASIVTFLGNRIGG